MLYTSAAFSIVSVMDVNKPTSGAYLRILSKEELVYYM